MVDQALALRPEERRPLFEEVAGVRRHERRRRKAEEQLTESEANLARVDDILAELRPQARRLAAQAEQQATRSSIADELAAALLASTHARWHVAAARLAAATERRRTTQVQATESMAALEEAERGAGTLADELAARADQARERRDTHEAARAALTGLQLRDGRLASEVEAFDRDRRRLADERSTAETEATAQRRSMAAPVPIRDLDLEAAVTEADRELADALAELATLRSTTTTRGDDVAAIRRAEGAREAEAETARRRLAEAQRHAVVERAAAAETGERRDEVVARADAAREALDQALEEERVAAEGHSVARDALAAAEAERASMAEQLAIASAAVAALGARVKALAAQLDEEERRPIAQAARKTGGRRVDEDLAVDPGIARGGRRGPRGPGSGVSRRIRPHPGAGGRARQIGRRGTPDDSCGPTDGARSPAAGSTQWRRPAAAPWSRPSGGTRPAASVGCSIGRSGLPDLAACIELQPTMPPGWLAVPRDGVRPRWMTPGVALGAVEFLDRHVASSTSGR